MDPRRAILAPALALVIVPGSAVIAPETVDFVVSPQTLYITAQSKATSADVDSAIAEMQQRLLAIKTGLGGGARRRSRSAAWLALRFRIGPGHRDENGPPFVPRETRHRL